MLSEINQNSSKLEELVRRFVILGDELSLSPASEARAQARVHRDVHRVDAAQRLLHALRVPGEHRRPHRHPALVDLPRKALFSAITDSLIYVITFEEAASLLLYP